MNMQSYCIVIVNDFICLLFGLFYFFLKHLYVDFSEPFLMMVAAGPFTTSDSLCYEPLADLMKTVQNDKPDLLILV